MARYNITSKDWELVEALKDRKCKVREIARICSIPSNTVSYMLYNRKYGILGKRRAAAQEVANEAIAAVVTEPISLQVPAKQLDYTPSDGASPLEIPIRLNISVSYSR